GIAEDRLDAAFDKAVKSGRKVGAAKARHAAFREMVEDIDRKPAIGAPLRIDEPHLLHLIAEPPHLGNEAHLLGHVIAHAPEVDDVAAGAQARRLLDQHRLVAEFGQPPGERGPADAGTVDRHLHREILSLETVSQNSAQALSIPARSPSASACSAMPSSTMAVRRASAAASSWLFVCGANIAHMRARSDSPDRRKRSLSRWSNIALPRKTR